MIQQHAQELLALGFKLCALKPGLKVPVGEKWNINYVRSIEEDTFYGMPLAINHLCTVDPDEVEKATKGMAALGFNLGQIMSLGVRTISTRPGSGGRSTFKDPGGLKWIKFVGKFMDWNTGELVPQTLLELRAHSENLQDVLPGLTYFVNGSGPYTQKYANGKTFADAPPLPEELLRWWRRMSEDHEYLLEQQRIFVEACGGVAQLTYCTGKHLPFPSNFREQFNAEHHVEDILAEHGYEQHGKRWRCPASNSSPGARPIPGKDGLWQSDNGTDPLNGMFDAWSAYVILAHDGNQDAAEAEVGGQLFDDEVEAARENYYTDEGADAPPPKPKANGPAVWPNIKLPGVAGELAEHLMERAPQRIEPFAVAAALTTIAALSGGEFCVDRTITPMNPYFLTEADTGTGKDGYLHAAEVILREVPGGENRAATMANLSSGQGLVRRMAEKNRCLLISMDEMAHHIKAAGMRDNANGMSLMSMFLEIFSGGVAHYSGRGYADSKRDIPAVDAPFLVLIGAATPQMLWGEALKRSHLEQGLLNRVLIIPAIESVDNDDRVAHLPPALLAKLEGIAASSMFDGEELPFFHIGNVQIRQWPITDEAHAFWKKKRDKLKTAGPVWARAAELTLRLAGLIALADQRPIAKSDMQVAWQLVDWSISYTEARIEADMVESPSEALVKRILHIIANGKTEDPRWKDYCKPGLVPKAYLYHALTKKGDVEKFKIKNAIEVLMEGETIRLASIKGKKRDLTGYEMCPSEGGDF